MKKGIKYFTFMLIVILFALSGCETSGVTTPDVITVTAKQETVELKDNEISRYQFTELFTITVNDQKVEVLESYLNLDDIKTIAGSYTLTCTYRDQQDSITVTVLESVCEVTLSIKEITINQAEYDTYDFKSLFTVKIDGVSVSITDDMIETNLSKTAGTYNYTVKAGNVSETLIVNVTDEHLIEAIITYPKMEISITDVLSFDYTQLFALYVDGKAVQVTKDMINTSSLSSPVVGRTYQVSFTYQLGNSKCEKTTQITVVEESQLVINAKNIETYPNGELIDLTTLFEISKGNEKIPVTTEMITGSIDYSQAGQNTITLNYNGITKTAIVEVKLGVIIKYAKSDTIIITKGTNQNAYAFIEDFVVIINGLTFTYLPNSYLSLSEVDFSKIGTYPVKLTIPFNDKELGLTSINFDYYEKEITYVVVENTYEIVLNTPEVQLPKGTTSYDVFTNISVSINNRNQTLTTNPEYVDRITCYAQVLSNSINFNQGGSQEVEVAIYVNGVEVDPVIVKYQVIITSDIVVTNVDHVMFSGDTLYTKDLFVISQGEENVEITYDMITGKVDTFKPGVYEVTLNYQGLVKTSTVIVFDEAIKGIYHTNLRTIAVDTGEEDDEGNPVMSSTTRLGDLIINGINDIVVNGTKASIVKGLDENTMIIKVGSYEYMLFFDNGIVVLDPDNSIKLGFNDYKRPMVYFHEDYYQLMERVEINYSTSHVLQLVIMTYSFDVFKIKSISTEQEMWYGLKIELVEKTSSDTVYVVSWGEVEFASDFKMLANTSSSLTFNNLNYSFDMQTDRIGKISRITEEKKYANKTFTGTFNGQAAEISSDQYEGFRLIVGGKTIFSVGSYELGSMTNGGVDYRNNTLHVYSHTNDDIYSYKFVLNTTNNTFTLVERDQYFGYYTTNKMYLFIDGYGMGLICFDTSSYSKTSFVYQVQNNELTIRYINTKPTFAYGTYAILYTDTLLNTLTVKETAVEELNMVKLVNQFVTDGAIININNYKVGQNSDTVARTELLSYIEIITKDGVLNDIEKSNCIDTSKIRFSQPGFYQFTITITVGNKNVVSYYAIEILESVYSNNALMKAYGSGVIYDNSLSINQYGQATIISNNVIYRGVVISGNDNEFIIKANNDTGQTISLTGSKVADGIVLVRCSGTVSFIDYYTTGTSKVAGISNNVLREFNVGNNYIYILAGSATSTGEIVTVESLNNISPSMVGAIIKITSTSDAKYVKIVDWSSATAGLMISDDYRGTYTLNTETIILDGFGSISINNKVATYTLSGSSAVVINGNFATVYRLNKSEQTYETSTITLNNSLVEGKSYTANYVFVCTDALYSAETTFTFKANGVVQVKSLSSSHDSGDEACSYDRYEPPFASGNGVNGTYSVNGNKITISVNGYQFTFVIDNILTISNIKCEQTTVDSDAQGYFSSNTVFMKK